MSATIHTFDLDLKKFAHKLNIKLSLVVKRTAFDVFGRIVRRTPVDTGRARASWNMAVGSPGDFVQPKDVQYASKADATAAAMGNKLPDAAFSSLDCIYIYNNVEYIGELEYGKSTQAPAGMVQVSIAEVEAQMASKIYEYGWQL